MSTLIDAPIQQRMTLNAKMNLNLLTWFLWLVGTSWLVFHYELGLLGGALVSAALGFSLLGIMGLIHRTPITDDEQPRGRDGGRRPWTDWTDAIFRKSIERRLVRDLRLMTDGLRAIKSLPEKIVSTARDPDDFRSVMQNSLARSAPIIWRAGAATARATRDVEILLAKVFELEPLFKTDPKAWSFRQSAQVSTTRIVLAKLRDPVREYLALAEQVTARDEEALEFGMLDPTATEMEKRFKKRLRALLELAELARARA